MKILICDDEEQYLDIMKVHIQEYMRNRYIECEITATNNPSEIYGTRQIFDLAFLDIQMKPIDGITLGKALRRRNEKLALFFITNFDEYQDDAMDLQAFRFFKKPFEIERLYLGLDKAMEYIDGAYVNVFMSSNGRQQRILVDDILYVTRSNRKTLLVAKQDSYITKETLDDWSEKLPQRFFYPVHKSFLVNLHYVSRYAYSELLLEDGTHIPVAPSKQSSFRKFWFAYLGGSVKC
uniref:LytR/AlgR family response regulator transcription factor n=1 Tax=Acetatifactor sp. TaxID=1872090 RepID=UPI004056E825